MPLWTLRWWNLSPGSYAIFSNCKHPHLPWVWESQIQSCTFAGRSALSCSAMETVLDMTSAWNASIISDTRTTSIYNPSFIPKG